MKPTLEELEEIQTQKQNESKRRSLAISLNICPDCGEKLISRSQRAITKYFLGFIPYNSPEVSSDCDTITECPNGHYKNINYYY